MSESIPQRFAVSLPPSDAWKVGVCRVLIHGEPHIGEVSGGSLKVEKAHPGAQWYPVKLVNGRWVEDA